MIHVKSIRAVGVNDEQFIGGNPLRSLILNVLPSVVFPSRAVRVSRPIFSAPSVDFVFPKIVTNLLEHLPTFNVSRIAGILFSTPSILVFGILPKVFRRSFLAIKQRANLALVRNGCAFFVVFGAGFVNSASGANLGNEWLSHRDIIASRLGDVKQGENGETPIILCLEKNARPIPCQASTPKRVDEGVTTRFRAKAVMSPRAPCPSEYSFGDEIVCSAWEHAGASDKEPRTKTYRTTIQQRSGQLADNLTNNNALLKKLRERGNVRPFSGGNVILEEIMYNDTSTNNANSYSGYELINISPDSPISAAQFSITQYADAVTMSGLEMLQNSGKEQIIDLLDGRMNVAEARLLNRIAGDIYLDGTGNGGKNITGLAAAVADTNTNTYGGIDRGTWAFWKNVVYSGVTNGGAAVSAANIQAYMTALAIQLVRGNDKADLIVADNNYYSLYVNSLQAIQRIASEDTAGAGFASLKFYGGGTSADVVLDGGIGASATANHMWFLNTKYIFLRPHKDRNFVPIGGERQAINQDAIVKLIGWAGNLTCSGAQFNGVLKA